MLFIDYIFCLFVFVWFVFLYVVSLHVLILYILNKGCIAFKNMTESVAEILRNTKETLFSFEVLPPVKGKSIEQVFHTIDGLLPFNPAFIEVTTHRSDYVYKEVEPGRYVRVEDRLRPGSVAVACAIKQRYGIPVVPHVICSGNTRQETENELIDLAFFDIFDLLVLRGDKSKSDNRFIPKEGGLTYADELCSQIGQFNDGKLVYGDIHHMLENKRPFSYGVAGYPEKHEEAMSLKMDMDVLKRKIDAGASYVVTQMFFDNKRFFDFCERCLKAGIDVPIVPGIKPIGTLNHRTMLPRTFHIDFPDPLADELLLCQSNAEVQRVGIEWASEQCLELKKAGVPCLHFYTMNAANAIAEIMKGVNAQ